MATRAKSTLFLSHSHRDRQEITRLQRLLDLHGAPTYLDQDRMLVGHDLPERIREGIDACCAILLVWSVSAKISLWVPKEVQCAQRLHKPIFIYRLDATDLPADLVNQVWLDAQDRRHANGGLLQTLFGPTFQPASPYEIFPGEWYAEWRNPAFQGSFRLHLRVNGQIEGQGRIGSGAGRDLLRGEGFDGILDAPLLLRGDWSYDEERDTLTLETIITELGATRHETTRIRFMRRQDGVIAGQDLGGFGWVFRRLARKGKILPEGETENDAWPSRAELKQMSVAHLEEMRRDGVSEEAIELARFGSALGVYVLDVLEEGDSFHCHRFSASDREIRLTPFVPFRDGSGRKRRALQVATYQGGSCVSEKTETWIQKSTDSWRQLQFDPTQRSRGASA